MNKYILLSKKTQSDGFRKDVFITLVLPEIKL